MNPTVKLMSSGPGGASIGKVLKDLTNAQVFVGIPEARNSRGAKGITNAELAFLHTNGVRGIDMRQTMNAAQRKKKLDYKQALALYIHTYGSPLWQVPPRPIIEPAIEDKQNRKIIEAELQLAAKAALEGKQGAMKSHLRRAGLLAQNLVRQWFTNPKNNWAPNAPSTIKRKGSSRPLIDTGELRKAITYVVEGA